MPTALAPELADRIYALVACAARQPDVQAAVESNHDDNRWWPLSVADWRVRMTVAGWSTRVSYSMISTYADVVSCADARGWSGLTALDDDGLAALVRPLGLSESRVSYLRSLAQFLGHAAAAGTDLTCTPPEDLIPLLASGVYGAGYKVAQCATLYARGYHCGVVPVDSGMVSRLAPFLGIRLSPGPEASERFRHLLQAGTAARSRQYKDLAAQLGYQVSIPLDTDPTWLVHLILIYFKRLYLNRPGPRLCPRTPACGRFLDCDCDAL